MSKRKIKKKKVKLLKEETQETIICEKCKAIFTNKMLMSFGRYRDNDTSNNAWVESSREQMKDGECPMCRHITNRLKGKENEEI